MNGPAPPAHPPEEIDSHRPNDPPEPSRSVLLAGASVRALARSARRAGFDVVALDLFGDEDLRACARSVHVVPMDQYPEAVSALAQAYPGVPRCYTGGLENHPRLLDSLAETGPLWGNRGSALEIARSPFRWASGLQGHRLPVPECLPWDDPPAEPAGWLLKRLAGTGGGHVRPGSGRKGCPGEYFQRGVAGRPASALFLGMPGATLLLGATRQWLAKDVPSLAMIARDRPFTYVGSAGPMSMAEGLRTSLERLGRLLGEEIGLRGVFGVDFVEADGQAVVIEINPRYPASAELIEESLGINLFEMHRRCFVADSARPIHSATALPASNGTWAKAIVYATSSVRLARPLPVWEGESTPVGCADRPAVGTLFEPGQPICTLLARLSSPDRLDWPNEQVEQLRQDYLSEC